MCIIPCTRIWTISVYAVSPATAMHVNCCPCRPSVTRGMAYSNSVRFTAVLMISCDEWFLHSIEVTGMLVKQLIVTDWPTVRGFSRPEILIPESVHSLTSEQHYKTTKLTNSHYFSSAISQFIRDSAGVCAGYTTSSSSFTDCQYIRVC